MCYFKYAKFLLVPEIFDPLLDCISTQGNYCSKINLPSFFSNIKNLSLLKTTYEPLIIILTMFAICLLFNFYHILKLYILLYNFMLYFNK